MIRRRADACVIHRPALIDFVERQALGPDSPAALDHLARCAPCERDLTEVAQAVFALRRLGAHAGEVEPPADGWTTLRVRIERSQRAADDAARRFRRAFGGAVVAVAVAALVADPEPDRDAHLGDRRRAGGSARMTRPVSAETRRYDPCGQQLTEGIVLAIAGNGPARLSLAERVSGGPTSTDRT